MNDAEKIIQERKEHRQGVLSCFLTLGYPTLEKSIEAMVRVANAGADLIEIGLPFSDPMADGPAIQHASTVALTNGTKISDVWEAVDQLKSQSSAGILLMGYYNTFLQYPLQRMIDQNINNGVSALIIPDLPPEHVTFQVPNSLGLVHLVAPNSPKKRIEIISQRSRPFVYLTSNFGVTGSNLSLHDQVKAIIHHVKTADHDQSILVGFGIDSAEKAKKLMTMNADGVIVGSALLRRLGENGNVEKCEKLVRSILSMLR